MADSPIVRNQMKIAVANAAVGNGDFNFLRSQFPRIVTIGEQLRSGCVCCQSLNLGHDRSEFLIGVEKARRESHARAGPQKWSNRFEALILL